MKRIGGISDTHNVLPDSAFGLFDGEWSEDELREAISRVAVCEYDSAGKVSIADGDDVVAAEMAGRAGSKVDLILHAGDICKQSILDQLEAIAPTIAVLGNNDIEPLFCSDGRVQGFRSLTYDGIRIAMAHISGDLNYALHSNRIGTSKPLENMPQLAIYGHTHKPNIAIKSNYVLLNPGSASRGRNGSGHNVALVDVDDGRLQRIAIVRV